MPFELQSVYFKADFIVRQNPINIYDIEKFLDEEVEDPVSELIKISKEVTKEIIGIKGTLLANSPRRQE